MHGTPRGRSRSLRLIGIVVGLAVGLAALVAAAATQSGEAAPAKASPKFSDAVAFDTSKPVRSLPKKGTAQAESRSARQQRHRA